MQKPKAIQVTQNDTTITIHLQVEKAHESDSDKVDIDVNDCDVVFTADPYFLRIKFNQPLVEGGPNFHIQIQQNAYVIRLGKLNYKEHFTGLDQPDLLVQEIDEELRDVLDYQEEGKSEEFSYGFNNEVNFEISQEISELAGCIDPRKIPVESRLMKKCETEQGLFNEDRYIQDNYDEETLEQISQFIDIEMPSQQLEQLMENLNLQSTDIQNSKQDYLKAVVFDLLFAYLYEQRFQFFGQLSDTSVMNITQLSQTLSNHINPNCWQNPNNRAKAYLVSSFRRVLIFAIFRNFDLCLKVKNDVCQLNKQQTIGLLQDLLQLFNSQATNMQWATYYIKKSLEYVQTVSQFNFEEFQAIQVEKVDLCLQLELIDNELN